MAQTQFALWVPGKKWRSRCVWIEPALYTDTIHAYDNFHICSIVRNDCAFGGRRWWYWAVRGLRRVLKSIFQMGGSCHFYGFWVHISRCWFNSGKLQAVTGEDKIMYSDDPPMMFPEFQWDHGSTWIVATVLLCVGLVLNWKRGFIKSGQLLSWRCISECGNVNALRLHAGCQSEFGSLAQRTVCQIRTAIEKDPPWMSCRYLLYWCRVGLFGAHGASVNFLNTLYMDRIGTYALARTFD